MKKKYTLLSLVILLVAAAAATWYFLPEKQEITAVSKARVLPANANAYGYKLGYKVHDFSLRSTDGKVISMKNYPDAKGFIVVFTCNSCLYSQVYEDRIRRIDSIYSSRNWPLLAINPNNPRLSPEDSYQNMAVRAKKKKYTFPYLADQNHKVADEFGATHTPMVFLVKKENADYLLKYIGTLDDNTWDDEDVSTNFVEKAILALNNGHEPEVSYTKSIGCTIKK